MKRILLAILATIIAMTAALEVGTVTALANGKCEYEGCDAENTPNGTVFCDEHAEAYAKEKGYKVCKVSGCWASASQYSNFCSRHTCIEQKCYRQVVNGSRKCINHISGYRLTSDKSNITDPTPYHGKPLEKRPPRVTTKDSSASQSGRASESSGQNANSKRTKAYRKSPDGYSIYKRTQKSSSSGSSTKKSTSKSTSKKKYYDPYDAKKYKSAQDFADDKYE